jgi:CheY-like chemotaxis protein
MTSINDIQSSISDGKTLDLLRTIGLEPCNSEILFNKSKFTRKQFYSRITRLTNAGLIRRNKGKYFLTSFGKVVFKYRMAIERALDNYWQLKALDSLEMLDHIPIEERKKLSDNLIDDYEIKYILDQNEWLYSSPCSATKKIENKTETSAAVIEKQQQQQRRRRKELPLKIMLVEDEADVLLTYKSFLDTERYNVEAFTNPYDALHSFIEKNGHYYDLIIIDIRMPGINGLQLYRTLKAIDDSVKVLFISALDAAEAVSILDGMDLSNFVRKPISKQEFVKKVSSALLTAPEISLTVQPTSEDVYVT